MILKEISMRELSIFDICGFTKPLWFFNVINYTLLKARQRTPSSHDRERNEQFETVRGSLWRLQIASESVSEMGKLEVKQNQTILSWWNIDVKKLNVIKIKSDLNLEVGENYAAAQIVWVLTIDYWLYAKAIFN